MAALDRLISATLAKGFPLGSAFRAWDSRLFIRKNVRAHLQASLLRVRGSFTGYQFQLGPLPAFVERLQPECLGDVQNAFRQPMQRRGPGIETTRQSVPPVIQQRVVGY